MSYLFNPREVMSAAPDFLALALGEKVKRPHPIAEVLTLKQVAYAAGAISRPDLVGADREQMLVSVGAASGEVGRIIADSSLPLTVRNYDEQAFHKKFCDVVEVKNFKPTDIPALDGDLGLVEQNELGEDWLYEMERVAGVSGARLRTYSKLALLSRRDIYNDSFDGFSKSLGQFGTSVARLESRLVAVALESNHLLDDGLTAFDLVADKHNNVLLEDLTGTSLGKAMAKLRNQRTSVGNLSDLAARHLVVSPDLEFSANAMLAASSLNITVTALGYLPEGRWYLLADPKVQPSVGILKLKDQPSIQMLWLSSRQLMQSLNFSFDGIAIRVRADFGASILGRQGIVRGGTTTQPVVTPNGGGSFGNLPFPKVDGYSQ